MAKVLAKDEATVCFRELDLFLQVMLLENAPAELGEKLPLDEWTETTSHLERQEIQCDTWNHVPFVVPGSSTSSSSSSTSSTSSSQEVVTDTEVPATRSESAGEDPSARGHLRHEPIEIENPNKNGDEELQDDVSCKVCLIGYRSSKMDWLMKVLQNIESCSSSHELHLDPRARVVPSKHNLFSHFPKDPNCDICLKTKNEGFLQKTHRYSRAQSGNFRWFNNCGSQRPDWRMWAST